MTPQDPLATPAHRAFNSTINLHNTVKRIVDHVTEPGATLSEDQVGCSWLSCAWASNPLWTQ